MYRYPASPYAGLLPSSLSKFDERVTRSPLLSPRTLSTASPRSAYMNSPYTPLSTRPPRLEDPGMKKDIEPAYAVVACRSTAARSLSPTLRARRPLSPSTVPIAPPNDRHRSPSPGRRFIPTVAPLSPVRALSPLRATSPTRSLSPGRDRLTTLAPFSPARRLSPFRTACELINSTELNRQRALSPIVSRRALSPVGSRLSPSRFPISPVGDAVATLSLYSASPTLAKDVLRTIAALAEGDARLEDAKRMLSVVCTLPAVFSTIDHRGFGFVTDMSLWNFMHDAGSSISIGDVSKLMHEVQLRQPVAMRSIPGRLYMREFAALILPFGSRELDIIRNSSSEADVKGLLYHEFDGQPLVTLASQQHLVAHIEAAAQIAVAQDRERKNLHMLPGFSEAVLNDIYKMMSSGFQLTMDDLWRAFVDHLAVAPISVDVFDLLRFRCAPLDGNSVFSFSEFARQLRPLA